MKTNVREERLKVALLADADDLCFVAQAGATRPESEHVGHNTRWCRYLCDMDSLADLSDQTLLARTCEQPDAFGVFYRRHEQAVLGYMLRRTKDPDLSADLTAETFAAALQSVGRYRPGPEPASAWLFGIARNVLGSTIRRGRAEDRARRRLGIPALPLDPTVRQGLEALVDDIAVAQLLAEIPHDQSEAIRGRFLEESSYQDLARRTASSQAAVRKRVSRGLRTLRTRLKGET